MRVTIQDVEKIAGLAKLSVSEEEKVKFREQLDEMLNYVEKLNELDTDGVEPTFFVQHGSEGTREDAPAESLPLDEALRNAPARTLGFFRVPKIIPQTEKKG
jgi:aspartyl-tRNA(Asn)/glutamyl-tRNA(Gln) amidotransferase subunit C